MFHEQGKNITYMEYLNAMNNGKILNFNHYNSYFYSTINKYKIR